jgi:subtilisin family serine protease
LIQLHSGVANHSNRLQGWIMLNRMKRPLSVLFGSFLVGAAISSPVLTFAASPGIESKNISNLRLPSTWTLKKIDRHLRTASGEVEVVVRLAGDPVAIANGENARRVGGRLARGQQMAHTQDVQNRQNAVSARIASLGGKETGRVRIAYNAVIVKVDAQKLANVASMPEVLSIRAVGKYKMDLSTTVPYIGASAAQANGITGKGVRVAVIDSGIDYTHRNLGGQGTAAAYAAAYGSAPGDVKNTTTDGLFPTAKVIGGFDYVGEAWDGSAETPERTEDPDPIDFGGHGTHVADIIGGKSVDGSHVGVAPEAGLYAVKVCSAVARACNGVALLKAMDFALDPNGDGSTDDAVDVINLSLGSDYGQSEDDLTAAVDNAVRAGVIVVASAGNSGDRPYILGSPSSAVRAISVAQTQVPTAATIPLIINAPTAAVDGNTETVGWAPIVGNTTADVVYVGRGCLNEPIDNVPTDPYLADPAGKIALIDRGNCSTANKVRRASDAGAVGVIYGLVAPGDALTFANAGHCPADVSTGVCKPTIVVTQARSNAIKTAMSGGEVVNTTISESAEIRLIGGVVGTSSRGPQYASSIIKPDIGAPGASVSAVVRTGTGEEGFGGTSGAAPMVSGTAALLVQAYPMRSPDAIKALLMNTAETEIYTSPSISPGVLAPITRIGGGEVRVDAALASKTAAWDQDTRAGSLSFGYKSLSSLEEACRKLEVRNYANYTRLYRMKANYRYQDDVTNGAVKFVLPPSVVVPANSTATVSACMTIDAKKLPTWTVNGGINGGNGPLLQSVEFDGYLSIKDDFDDIHVAWHVLPHRAADTQATTSFVQIPKRGDGKLKLVNPGRAQAGQLDVFSLTGTSPRAPSSALPKPGDDFAFIDLASTGVRLLEDGGELLIQFAINTYGQRAHPLVPGGFEIDIDVDMDGTPDSVMLLGQLAVGDGRTVVFVVPPGSDEQEPVAFVDADLNSANMIMTAPLALLGLTPTGKFSYSVIAYDSYFTAEVTDSIPNIVYTPGVPKFIASNIPDAGVPAGGSATLTVEAIPAGKTASPSQTGLLLLYRDAKKNLEAQTVTVKGP